MSDLSQKKIRTTTLAELKSAGEKFAALTSYDRFTAEIFDESGIEVLLVGDSAANTVYGKSNTLEVSIQEMISLGRAVSSSAKRALVVIDMPFGSYEISAQQATENAIALIKHSGAEAVKLEGGKNRTEQIRSIIAAGIPVMGHLGFTPQSVHSLGGFKVQGRGESANTLIEDAKALEEAGVFAIVLELVPGEVAKQITGALSIPTIGIGAGNSTDGQILVWQDFAGLSGEKLKFVREYLQLREALSGAAKKYRDEVRDGSFPSPEHTFGD
ncbi:MAG: 3-methyl-2-oxobutanoate hydroxymethyltransferase [Actinomycetota bacterium]